MESFVDIIVGFKLPEDFITLDSIFYCKYCKGYKIDNEVLRSKCNTCNNDTRHSYAYISSTYLDHDCRYFYDKVKENHYYIDSMYPFYKEDERDTLLNIEGCRIIRRATKTEAERRYSGDWNEMRNYIDYDDHCFYIVLEEERLNVAENVLELNERIFDVELNSRDIEVNIEKIVKIQKILTKDSIESSFGTFLFETVESY